MAVRVDESRNDGGTRDVDALRAFGHLNGRGGANRCDFAVPNDDGRTVNRAAFTVDDPRADEGRRLTEHDTWHSQHRKGKDPALERSGPGSQKL
jgi:hypothetical protein